MGDVGAPDAAGRPVGDLCEVDWVHDDAARYACELLDRLVPLLPVVLGDEEHLVDVGVDADVVGLHEHVLAPQSAVVRSLALDEQRRHAERNEAVDLVQAHDILDALPGVPDDTGGIGGAVKAVLQARGMHVHVVPAGSQAAGGGDTGRFGAAEAVEALDDAGGEWDALDVEMQRIEALGVLGEAIRVGCGHFGSLLLVSKGLGVRGSIPRSHARERQCSAWRGVAWLGASWRGEAGQGSAGQGEARQGPAY